jgi:hypothetical protein
MTKRRCKQCGKLLPLTERYFWRDNKGYLRHTCRSCRCEQQRKRRAANREHVNELNRKWREANRKLVREQRRKWREANHELVREQRHKWREANHELMQQKGLVRRHKRRALKNGNGGSFTHADELAKLKLQNGCCYWCAVKFIKKRKHIRYHPKYRTIEHLIPVTRGGSNWPDNIVLACASCNFSKCNKLPDEYLAYRLTLTQGGTTKPIA